MKVIRPHKGAVVPYLSSYAYWRIRPSKTHVGRPRGELCSNHALRGTSKRKLGAETEYELPKATVTRRVLPPQPYSHIGLTQSPLEIPIGVFRSL